MISICRDHAGNVKRWQDGTMALRWCAAGMVEAGKQFRRVNGYLHLAAFGRRWRLRSPRLSPVRARIRRRWRRPDDHPGAATEVQRTRDILEQHDVRLGCQIAPCLVVDGRGAVSAHKRSALLSDV
jgi:hypothetical protein